MPFARSRKSQNPPPERARARRDTHSFDAERISIVGAELLRGDAADDARRFIDIADVAEVMIAGDGEAPAPRGTEGYLASPFCLLIGEPVPAASGNGEPCSEPLRQSSAKCEAFDTIYPEKIRDAARRYRCSAGTRERLGANERSRLVLDLRDIGVGDRAHIGRKRIEHSTHERKRHRRSARGERYFRTRKYSGRERLVHLVAADLPPPADDSARRVVEPLARPPDLDLLPAGKPEAFDEPVLEDDTDVLEVLVPKGRAGEAECHANHFPAFPVDIDSADGSWLAVVLWPDAHFVDVESTRTQANLKRVADCVVVLQQAAGGKRMRHVADFVAVTESYDVGKIVLDYAEVVAMVIDVRREQRGIAPSGDELLAQVRRVPIHF